MFNFLALLDIRVFGCLYSIVASDWPRTFFIPKVFLFSINTYNTLTQTPLMYDALH